MSAEKGALAKLKESILDYDASAAELWAKKAMEEKMDPVEVANNLTDTIREVGEAFGCGEIFLPELIAAANAGKQAMSIIEEELRKAGQKQSVVGSLVIGTVKGDIHDIGKNIVATMFFASGFRVIDLGVDVSPEKFLEAVQQNKPDILGISALLSTTAPEQKNIIELIKKSGIRDQIKVMVGGGAISQRFADQIGADGYAANASEAVEVARKVLKIQSKSVP